MPSAFKKTIKELNSMALKGMRLDLYPVRESLHLLGNPHLSYPVVHVAGTNGKGSTCTFIASILKEAGYKTGLTLSPHIESVRERIQINNQSISEKDFTRIHRRLASILGIKKHTYFEWLILIMFVYFAEENVDISVLETGMGGRWDATNVVMPLVSVITNVSRDHEQYLGNTLSKILSEKMQIIKKGEAWTGIHDASLLKQLKSHAKKVGAKLLVTNKKIKKYSLGLAGEHQQKNAALALGVISSLKKKGFRISQKSILEGFKRAFIPGRLELLNKKPHIWVDGAHNEDGLKQLLSFIKSSPHRYHLLLGCLNDRPLEALAKMMMPHVDSLTLAFFKADRMRSLSSLKKISKKLSKNTQVLDTSDKKLKKWLESFDQNDHIIIAGSLYLVSQVRPLINN